MHDVAPAAGWYWLAGQGEQTRSLVAVLLADTKEPGWHTRTGEHTVLEAPPHAPLIKVLEAQVAQLVQRGKPVLLSFQVPAGQLLTQVEVAVR